MRNLKRALSLTLASVMLLGMMVMGTSAASFPDVDDNDNVEAIEVLAAVEVIVGDNGNFKPDDPVTRNEMAVIMAKLLNLDYNYYEATCPFTDVASWARGWVGACQANGIIAGRSATTFDGNATVTAVEAAAMMMRALGYFKYDSDYADGFVVSTVRQASKIGLFADVNANTNSPMTRNQVAQLALNTLEATIVDAQKTTADITVGSGETAVNIEGAVQYIVRTDATNSKMTTAIKSNANSGASGVSGINGQTIELGEQLYNGDLQKRLNQTDSMGRPAVTWIYKNSTIGTYSEAEEHTVYVPYASTPKTIAKMIEDIDKNYKIVLSPVTGETKTVIALNGANQTVDQTLLDNGSFLKVGDRLEVFMDDNNPGNVKTIAITHWRADKMTGNASTRADGNDTLVRLPGVSGLSTYNSDNTTETVHGWQDLVEDDIVLVYQDKEEEYWVEKAESFTGTLTAVEGAGSGNRERVTVNGQKYEKSGAANFLNGDNDRPVDFNKTEATWFLDKAGNYVWVSGTETTEVAYVLEHGTGTSIFGTPDKYVKLLTSEGTVVSGVSKEDYSVSYPAGTVVKYSLSDEKYTLETVADYTSGTAGKLASANVDVTQAAVQKGNPNVTSKTSTTFRTNSETVFFIRTYDGATAKDAFTSYTGYANVPSIDAGDMTGGKLAAYIGSDGYADYVFIDANKGIDTSADDLFYVVDNTITRWPDGKGGFAYSVKAIKNGETEIIDLKFASDPSSTGTASFNGGVAIAADTAYTVTSYNSDDEITAYSTAITDGTVPGNAASKYAVNVGTGKGDKEVVVLNGIAYKYDDNTKFYRIDKNDKLTMIGANEIDVDANDKFVAVRDSGTATDAGYYFVKTVFLREVEDPCVHTYTYTSTDATHTGTCTKCGATTGAVAHTVTTWTAGSDSDSGKHVGECTACHETAKHTPTTGDWEVASGAVTGGSGAVSDGQHYQACGVDGCSLAYGAGHAGNSWKAWAEDGTKHTRQCNEAGCGVTQEHTKTPKDNATTADYEKDSNGHTVKCGGTDCTLTGGDKEDHYKTTAGDWSGASTGETCAVCGQAHD